MRTSIKYCLAALGLIAALALAPPATAQIAGTAHDLSGAAPGGQICVSCHAPHAGAFTILLWNHTMSGNAFAWSDATKTSSGTTLPVNIDTWSGSTKMCLSCHDGSVAIGDIIDPAVVFDPSFMDPGHQVGPDLKGNHPVAIPYPNPGTLAYNAITTAATASDYNASPANVKLFSDPTTGGKGIECASCHNPHGTANPNFLRAAIAGSAICLNCHIK